MNTEENRTIGASAAWALARSNKFLPQIMFDAEDGTGSDGGDDAAAKAAAAKAAAEKAAADKAAADKAAADKAAADKTDDDKKSGLSDREADLLKESMGRKKKLQEAEAKLAAAQAELDKFKDIDPTKAKELLAKEKEAEKALLESKGEFDRLKKMMAEEHAKEIEKIKTEQAAKEQALATAQAVINDLTIGQAFLNSEFVKGDLVMPASKVRAVYGPHFEVKDGRVVAFDKPKGAENRTMLVDGAGDPMSFEAAMQKIIDADPDRDNLLRSKIKEGAGSKTSKDDRDKSGNQDATSLKGLSRMVLALQDRKANVGK